jgi:two-component system sensor histidine kinase BaeS
LAPRGGDELADALHNINSMAASLGELEKTRRIWLAQISHELRTPLTALSGELDALLDSVRPLTIEAVESLREEVTRLARLIDDLHLVALADVRALPCQFAPDDVAAVVRQAAARFAPRAATAGLELVVAGCEAPVAVCWDTRRIEQLLANLLANAVRYTDAPGRIVLHAYREGNATVLDVRDSKPGVPPDRRIRLLEPLFRVEESRDRNQGGSGLGLSVCAAIARAHGGTVELDQSDLGGLRVCVRLPARAP